MSNVLKFPSSRKRDNDCCLPVLDYIIAQGENGATEEEIILALGKHANGVRYRCYDLKMAGKIERASFSRSVMSGRAAKVWVATKTQGETREG